MAELNQLDAEQEIRLEAEPSLPKEHQIPQRAERKQEEPDILASSDEVKSYIRALRREAKTYRTQLQEIQAQYQEAQKYVEKYKEIETRYKALEEQIRNDLLNRLPEDRREKYKDWDVEKLRVVVSDFEELEKPRMMSPGVVPGRPLPEKKFEEMSDEERLQLRQINPELYFKLLQESVARKLNVSLKKE